MFNYKYKIKMSGCPNDCTAAIGRSDMGIIGVWKDEIQVDQAEFAKYVESGKDIQVAVIDKCPSKCISVEGNEIKIDDSDCVKCMQCINVLPKALRVGKKRGAAITLGAKAPIVEGALFGSVIVPFIDLSEGIDELCDLIERIWEFWDDNGKSRERIGEFIERVGLATFVEGIGLEPLPQMIRAPRDNPYVFYEEYFEEE
jgi:sulfite reductase alpha subunit